MANEKKMVIYRVTNTSTGKSYIGQTRHGLEKRRKQHLTTAANNDRKDHTHFHHSIRKHGSALFTWEILEECDSLAHLNEREIFYIKLLNTIEPNGYNSNGGGLEAGGNGLSENVRRRISEKIMQLHKDPAYRENLYAKLKGLTPPNKGKKASAEVRRKLSEARRALMANPTYINPTLGLVKTEEQRKKSAPKNPAHGDDWHRAHAEQFTDSVRKKMREAKLGVSPVNLGTRMSDEQKEKLKQAWVLRKQKGLAMGGKTKEVFCFQYDKKWPSMKACAEELGLHPDLIKRSMKTMKPYRGLTFKFAEPPK